MKVFLITIATKSVIGLVIILLWTHSYTFHEPRRNIGYMILKSELYFISLLFPKFAEVIVKLLYPKRLLIFWFIYIDIDNHQDTYVLPICCQLILGKVFNHCALLCMDQTSYSKYNSSVYFKKNKFDLWWIT